MSQRLRIAFAGFRHGHIMGLYDAARAHPDVDVVAAAEGHPATRETLECGGEVELTHHDWVDVINDVNCDAIAIGDYFDRRGEIAIAALHAGKHVIADKPICTRLDELDQIEQLSREKALVVSALLDLRDSGVFITARKLIKDGVIGELHTVLFTAQHPLNLGSRPSWYFEPGKHGGTINDIAIHATDLIPWMTGRKLTEVVAARAWNARLPQFPHFQDAAQLMLRLDNGGGVIGDVSYLVPDSIGYGMPQYWRVTCHGSDGVIEAKYGARTVQLATRGDKHVREIDAAPDVPDGRLAAFLQEVRGEKIDGALVTSDVLRASRVAVIAQQAADHNQTGVEL